MPDPTLDPAGQILLGMLLLAASYFDFRFRRIPNWLVLCGLVAGLSFHTATAHLPGFIHAGSGLAVGFALYFPLYLVRARGAGDVKLLAAVGAITGPGSILWIFIFTALTGGVVALAVVVWRKRFRKTLLNMGWIVAELSRGRAPHLTRSEVDVRTDQALRLPHGAVLALGSAVFLIWLWLSAR